jgi:hypothetical protein
MKDAGMLTSRNVMREQDALLVGHCEYALNTCADFLTSCVLINSSINAVLKLLT